MRDPDVAARYAAIQPPVDARLLAELSSAVTTHREERVRATALGAMARIGGVPASSAWAAAIRDPAISVRRRAAELGPSVTPPPLDGLFTLLGDDDPLVAETAAWALGEISWPGERRTQVVTALADAAGAHADPLVRESAVAALGAIGDDRGLPAILAACADRPPIRRRAVLALAPFEGPEVDAAIETALTDADWQVRQAAEDLR
jgi:HEAT repeat protein